MLFLIFFGVVFKKAVLSYDTNIAHPFLADKSVALFNSQNPANKLTSQKMGWIKQGAEEEDIPIRWMNHFYDPNTGFGLPGYAPANVWANLSLAQITYARGDQTWQTAISAYVNGDEKRAFIALGHVLHLIEDMAVPAHTRIDTHAEGDPYEDWVKANVNKNYDASGLIKIDNLNQAFNYLANYSNKYFFSKDTINKNYLNNLNTKLVLVDNKKLECYFAKDSDAREFCLVFVKRNFINPNSNTYFLDFKNHSDYYSLLAPKAIGYGAGVIDLFFREVGKEKNKKLSALEKVKQSAAKAGGILQNGLNSLLGKYQAAMTDYSFKIAGVSDNAANTASIQTQEQTSDTGKVLSAQEVAQGNNPPPSPSQAEGVITTPSSLPLPGGEPQNSPNPLYQGGKNTNPPAPLSKGGGEGLNPRLEGGQIQPPLPPLSGGNASIFVAGDTMPPDTSITFAPSLISSSTAAEFIFSSSEANSIFECDLDAGGWQACTSPKNLSSLADGEHVFKVRAIDQSGNADGAPAEYSWILDAAVPTITINDKPAGFASSTSALFAFSADEAAVFYCDLDQTGWLECASPVNYENLSEGAHNFKVKAGDSAGNQTASPAEYSWTISTSAAAVNIIYGPPDIASSTSAEFQLAANDANASYQCQLDLGGWQACTASTTVSDLSEGAHEFTARITDQAGNIGSSTQKTWLVDLTAPASTVASLPASYEATGFTVSWSGADADAAGATSTASGVNNYDLQYKIGAGEWSGWLAATSATSTVFNIAVDAGQAIYFRSRSRDLAGNLGAWSAEMQTSIASGAANHVVISEVQVAGAAADDEFIELYNPTGAVIDLSGYSIQYRGGGATSYSRKNFNAGNTITSKGYFLIANNSYDGAVSADMPHSSFTLSGITDGGTIFLVNDQVTLTENTDGGPTVIDKIAYGAGANLRPEGTAFPSVPTAHQSLERKAFATSTAETMATGGTHAASGNGYDSNNNSNDFVLNAAPNPQNSSGAREPVSGNQITVGNISTGASNWQNSFSWSHTVSGSDAVLLVTVHTDSDYVSSVSYGGQPMSLATKSLYGRPFDNLAAYVYYLINPAAGTHNVLVNVTYNNTPYLASAITLNNCDTANPINSAINYHDTTPVLSPHVVTITNPNEMIVDAVTFNQPQSYSLVAGSGQTQYYNNYVRGQANDLYLGESYKSAGQSGQQTMSWTADVNRSFVQAIITVNPKP